MKNLLLTLVAIFYISSSFSQVKNVEYSAPFDEPEKGWYKVLQLSNGYTFFLNFDNADGVEVTVYKPDRKIAGRKKLSSTIWNPKNLKNSTMEGIYEIAGRPVIFLQQLNDRKPQLFRIVLHPENGAIVNQQKIGELPKYGAFSGYAMAFGGVDQEDFIVEKDPYSDAYAVVHYNSFSKESDKRIELVHYAVENGEHVEINRSYYDAQDFKYTNYIGMTVNGDKAVHLAAYGYNTENSGGKDSRVIISRIKRGEKAFTNVNLEFTDDFKETEGLMNYNPETGMIQMLTLTLLKTKDKNNMFSNTSKTVSYYMALISYIDPESLQIIKKVLLPYDGLAAYVSSKGVGPDEFNGMPVNMILNNDNTTTILLEEKTEAMSSRSTTTTVIFNRIGVVTLDNTGKDVEAYAVYKNQIASGHPMENMYLAKRGKGMWSYRRPLPKLVSAPPDNRAFYSYDYINLANNNNYIIFNDNAENYNNGVPRIWADKIGKGVAYVSSCTTVFRKITNKGITAGYLYDKNPGKDDKSFCNIESSHFRKETGVYAALMVKKNKKEKNAYISWVTLE